MAPRRPLLAGNWKMNGTRDTLAEIAALREAVAVGRTRGVDVVICPPATLVMAAADLCRGSGLAIGGQDCAVEPRGAETGDLSAEMLGDAGAEAVIVGHSERRGGHGESDALVRAKAEAARRAGLLAIICVGETRAEHDDGDTLAVVLRQVERSVPAGATAATVALAYEPIWAIGTGVVPKTDAVASMHGDIRERLRRLIGAEADGVRILYGGSVKPDNAASLSGLRDVDGVLVGGASLKAADFLGIADAYR